MRARVSTLTAMTAGVLLLTAACGQAGSSGGSVPASTGSSAAAISTCAPMAGDKLVALEDDKGLQNSDNIIPAINTAAIAGDAKVVPLLDKVSATLDTKTLINLNKSVDVDRQTSSQAAAAYLKTKGLDAQDIVGAGKKIVVGAANFSESATLAEIYAGALKSAGYDATTQTIGNRDTYAPALEAGTLTIVPEYAATLTEYLNQKANGAEAPAMASSDLTATVGKLTALGKTVGLSFATPAAAQDQNAFAVTTAFAAAHKVKTLSDLATKCGGLVLGGPPECPVRPFCEAGLKKTYKLQITDFTSLDAGGPLTKAALQQGKIAVGLVFSSDAALAG